ncbi:hypothetical protein O7602_10810 [Micromonospora sp. WMMD1128]|uniref:hypothetical protein n=1 Tax=unclassified Micromonospora TaxID=2617518 RepID=UPI00248BD977|nr:MULTISPECIES: hypothetical protein [unclassified Micromonospora]WBB75966.1 hypothetical protein O7602_10810 [Micromonospora sp. WMMD1128]WFE36246.1 hypothetical protein O7613_12925 [Micromonospora sp. WMMD975]
MTDPYRITEAPAAAPGRPGARLRPLLWLALFVSAAANAVLTTALDTPWVGSGFGLVAMLCAAALIVHHRRHR